MDTLAHLITDLFEALGYPPKEHLEPEDAVRAVRRSLAFYDLDLGQSNQNQVVAKTAEFGFTSREKSLAQVAGVPLWLERKTGDGPGAGWHYVGAVNLAAVEDAWARGDERCAFYSGEKNALVVRLSYLPDGSARFRLWYDPNPSLEVTPADPILLNRSFYPMFTARAVLDAVPQVLLAAAKCEEPPSELQVAAWGAAAERAQAVLRDYANNWRQHKLGSRGAARGRNRRPVLARSGRGF